MKSNVLYSILGVVFSTIIPIIVFPYVSRVLGVTQLGEYNFYNSALTYLSLFSSFGITIYGVREIGKVKEDKLRRSKVLAELLCVNLIFTICCLLLVLYCILFTRYSEDYKIILIFSTVLITNTIGAEWFFVALEKQKYLLFRNIGIKIISLILIFLFVTNSEDVLLYAAITVFSLSAVSLLNIFYILKLTDFSKSSPLQIKKYLKPLFLIFIIEILLRYLGLGDVVILGNMNGDTAVGYYIMGLKIFLLVTSLMKVTAITLLPRSAFYLGTGAIDEYKCLLCQTVNLIFLFGVPCTLGLILWAGPIVHLFGGAEFALSIPLLQGFACLIIVSVIANMIVFQILYPLNKIKSIVSAHIGGVVINIVLNLLLIPSMSFWGAFYAFAIANISILLLLLLMERASIPWGIFSKNILKYLYAGFVFALAAMVVQGCVHDAFYFGQMAFCGVLYFALLYYFRETFVLETLTSLKLIQK